MTTNNKDFLVKNGLQVGGNTTIAGSLTASGLDYPVSDGSFMQAIVTDGTGNLSFENVDTVESDVTNNTGSLIAKGTPVYQTGAAGQTLTIAPSDASDANTMPAIGVAADDIADGDTGRVLHFGFIKGVDTSAFNEGDRIYVADGGGYQVDRPAGENHVVQFLGVVTKVHATNGSGVVFNTASAYAVPNLDDGNIFIGNASNLPTTATLDTDLVPEGTNQYFTNARAISAVEGASHLTIDGGTLYVDTSNNYVGINDTSPQQALDVTGAIAIGGTTVIDSGGEIVTAQLKNSGVTSGTYGSSSAIPVLTVDTKGRVTSASTASITTDLDIAGDSGTGTISLATETLTVAGDTGITTTVSGNTISVDLDDTAVTAGSYGGSTAIPVITIDQQGRITSASTSAVAGVDGVSYNSSTGQLTVETATGTDYSVDIGVGTGDSPRFVNLTLGETSTPQISFDMSATNNVNLFARAETVNTNEASFNILGTPSYGGTATKTFTTSYSQAALRTADKDRITVSSGGDIQFYDSVGTTAKFHWDAVDEHLGIGTTSPSEKLEVFGGDILLSTTGGESNTPNPSLKFEYANHQFAKIVGHGRDSSGYGDIDFYTSNSAGVTNLTQRMTIRADGNVGIGTDSPIQRLEVDGDVRIKDSHSLFFKRYGDNYAWRIRNESSSDSSTHGFDGSNDLIFEVVSNSNVSNATPGASSHTIYGSSANTLVLRESGRIGIGTDTNAQQNSHKLSIKEASTTGTVNSHLALVGDSATVGQGPQILFSESGDGQSYAGGTIGFVRTGSNSVGDLVFGTRRTTGDASTTTTEALRITSGGNVGIGTYNPVYKFHVDNGTSDGGIATLRNEEVGLNVAVDGASGTYTGSDRTVTFNATRMDGGSSPTLRLAGQGKIEFAVDANNPRVEMGETYFRPVTDNTMNLGTEDIGWKNIYTNDLQLSNMNSEPNEVDGTNGKWTIQEGEEDLFLINRRNGKKYKFNLTEID